ncbi:ABC-type dipeptide/oligopeptide/nickel transport system, permease component [Bradyrhizobium sp. YR681]|uniref:ABC transporter permease n=1 Tax=Bradyrhizobium sp. YR681 TaxID=1144344 RepID=UPI00027105D5|nr:ABC transporter permease [Bradyrhizobium sp. YR681]EJN11269.1 ABC-type dipeptide/oligopeptide/nickel transport system, permease component [Bradyrhizobium sp. YR681]
MTDVGLVAPSTQILAERRRFRVLRKLAAHRSFKIGLVLVTVLALCAIIGPMLTGTDPTAMSIRYRFKPPSARFPFGSDQYGRDILTRVLYGGRLSLGIGFSVALLSGVFGAMIGILAGYFRALDPYVMRLMDALMAFPAILLAIGIGAALGAQASSIVVALSVAYVPRTARIVRASVLVIREMEYLQAARVSGAGDAHIIVKHVLPNCLGPLIVQLTFIFAYAILAEATLSFLGIGPPPPAPSWGNIIAEGRDYSVEAWWVMLFPGLAVSLAALGMNLLGDGLRDVLDPRLKIET